MGKVRDGLRRHPAEVRYRIYAMRYDGATLTELLKDPEVVSSQKRTGVMLTAGALTAAFRQPEYRRYVEARERTFEAVEADRITREVLDESGALASVADAARYELACEIRALISRGASADENPVQRVERLARSLAVVSRDEVGSLRRELRDRDARIAELSGELEHVRAELPSRVKSSEVAEALDTSLGL